MIRTICRLPLPLGFEVFCGDPHGVALVTVPGRLDVFEIRSVDGLVVWMERNTLAVIISGSACARSAIHDGRHVLELIDQSKPSASVDHVIPTVEVLAMAAMDVEAAQACRAAIDLRRATRMAH